ncbi:hypothetical protein KOW79_018550 [Hemibagrus wyckioides]|uniref:Uncharacterized protein n=1 Tax=Hemibagrus wyckioides TaxID=337641 RepID=A0A9D3N8E2_9TELE|nr:hypothetical protein KOW79_018550 [Hemibagrus wyckioides]
MYRTPVTKPIKRLPDINVGKRRSEMKIIVEHVQGSRVGPERKYTEKTKLLPKRPSRDPIGLSPIRTNISVEKSNRQDKLSDIRVPKKGKIIKPASKPDDKEIYLYQMMKKLHQGVRPSEKPKVEVKGMTPKCKTKEKKIADLNLIEVLGKEPLEPQFSNSSGRSLRDKFTQDILHYIQSATYKRKLAERIMEEIDAKLEKAFSQSQEQQHAMRFSTAKAEEQNITQLGFSLCITPLIGFNLIESRDEIIECFNSTSTQIPTDAMTSTEIVENVFENILASVIDVDALNPDEDIDRFSPDSMINTLASHVFTVQRACEGILQSINTKDSQSPEEVTPPSGGAKEELDLQQGLAIFEKNVPSEVDEENLDTIVHHDHAIVGIFKKMKNLLTRSSESEVKGKHGGKVESRDDFIPLPQTSATEQDHKPDDVAEEQLVAKLGVDLDQDTPFEERDPSEVDEQDLQLIGHQEHASPVPSPPSSESRESPRGRTRPKTKARSLKSAETSLGKDESVLDNQTSAVEQDLKPEEGAEEQLTDGSDVDVEQVFATTFETTTAQDLHQESASCVPAPPSTKKPDTTRGLARRRTRPATNTKVLSKMEKAVKKGPVCSRTISMYAESLTSSRTPDHEESSRTLRRVYSALKTKDLPPKPEVPSAKSSVCDKEQDLSVSLDQKSSTQYRSVPTKTSAFPDCFRPCTCDCEEEEL